MPASRAIVGDEVTWWSDINGAYDRDDSLKENTNPKCLLKNHHHHPNGASSSSSQRFSGNLKPTAAPILGLPAGKKLGLQGGGGGGRHHPPAIFPKKAKTGGGGRLAKPAVPEPGSPKVSCFGKVGSERHRALRERPPAPRSSPPPAPRPSPPGCCGGLGSMMSRRSRSRNNSVVECVDQSPPPPPPAALPPSSSAAARRRTSEVKEAEAPAPPGLGGMRRFASGRRAADWAAEMEGDGPVARSGPL